MTTTIKRPQSPQVGSTAPTQAVQQPDRAQKLETLKQLRYLEPGVDGPETRENVAKLQSLLVDAGVMEKGQYKEGVFDDTTKDGVMRFQQEAKKRINPDMVVDGKVGQQTWGSFMGFKVPPGKDLLKDGGAVEVAEDKGWQAPATPAAPAPAAPAPAAPAPAAPAPAAPAPAAPAPATTTTKAPATAGPAAPAPGATDADLKKTAAAAQQESQDESFFKDPKGLPLGAAQIGNAYLTKKQWAARSARHELRDMESAAVKAETKAVATETRAASLTEAVAKDSGNVALKGEATAANLEATAARAEATTLRNAINAKKGLPPVLPPEAAGMKAGTKATESVEQAVTTEVTQARKIAEEATKNAEAATKRAAELKAANPLSIEAKLAQTEADAATGLATRYTQNADHLASLSKVGDELKSKATAARTKATDLSKTAETANTKYSELLKDTKADVNELATAKTAAANANRAASRANSAALKAETAAAEPMRLVEAANASRDAAAQARTVAKSLAADAERYGSPTLKAAAKTAEDAATQLEANAWHAATKARSMGGTLSVPGATAAAETATRATTAATAEAGNATARVAETATNEVAQTGVRGMLRNVLRKSNDFANRTTRFSDEKIIGGVRNAWRNFRGTNTVAATAEKGTTAATEVATEAATKAAATAAAKTTTEAATEATAKVVAGSLAKRAGARLANWGADFVPVAGSAVSAAFAAYDVMHANEVWNDPKASWLKKGLASVTAGSTSLGVIPGFGIITGGVSLLTSTAEALVK